jgi:hypothetical protein
VEQIKHVATGPQGGHQGCDWPQATAAFFMAANTYNNVVEEIKKIVLAFKQTEPLGGTFGI